MTRDERFISERFPKANKYHPHWILAGVSERSTPANLCCVAQANEFEKRLSGIPSDPRTSINNFPALLLLT